MRQALPIPMQSERGMVQYSATLDNDDGDTGDADEELANEAPVHRTFFPETWLWTLDRMRLACCSVSCVAHFRTSYKIR